MGSSRANSTRLWPLETSRPCPRPSRDIKSRRPRAPRDTVAAPPSPSGALIRALGPSLGEAARVCAGGPFDQPFGLCADAPPRTMGNEPRETKEPRPRTRLSSRNGRGLLDELDAQCLCARARTDTGADGAGREDVRELADEALRRPVAGVALGLGVAADVGAVPAASGDLRGLATVRVGEAGHAVPDVLAVAAARQGAGAGATL